MRHYRFSLISCTAKLKGWIFMDKQKIQRINELSKKSKTTGLSPEELSEQKELREEYIRSFRENLRSTLDSIVLVDKEGNKKPLKKRDGDLH